MLADYDIDYQDPDSMELKDEKKKLIDSLKNMT